MTHRLIVVCLVGVAVSAVFAGCEAPPEPPTTAAQQLTMTPQRAKTALLEMMCSKAGQDIGWFKGDVPDEMAKMNIEEEEDGWYAWGGAFRFHPSRAVYSFVVHPQPGVLACVCVFEGTFEIKDGKWTASPPKLVSRALTK